jgi:hypothetical protein
MNSFVEAWCTIDEVRPAPNCNKVEGIKKSHAVHNIFMTRVRISLPESCDLLQRAALVLNMGIQISNVYILLYCSQHCFGSIPGDQLLDLIQNVQPPLGLKGKFVS